MHGEFSKNFPDHTIFIWWGLYVHETFLVYKSETSKNCKEVKHILIMVIAVIYIFFVSCNISSLAENYFEKILSPSQKLHCPFSITLPLIPHPTFLLSPLQKGVGEEPVSVKIRVFQKKFKWHLYNYENYMWSKYAHF